MRSTLLFLVLSAITVAAAAEGNTNNGQVTLSRSRRTAKLNRGKPTSSRSRKKHRKWGPTLYQIPDMYNGPLLEHESQDLDYFEGMDHHNENYQGVSPKFNKYNENRNDYSTNTNINSRGIHNNKNYYMDTNNNINKNGLYGSFDGTQGLVDSYNGGYNGKVSRGFPGGEQTGFGQGVSGFGNSRGSPTGYPQMFGESHNRNEFTRRLNGRMSNMVGRNSNGFSKGKGFGKNLINERLSNTVAGNSNGFLQGNGFGNNLINGRLSNTVGGNSNGFLRDNGFGNNLIKERLSNMVGENSNGVFNGNNFGNGLINERFSNIVGDNSNGFLNGNGFGNNFFNERMSKMVGGNTNGVLNGNWYGNNLINAGKAFIDNKMSQVFQNGGYFSRADSRRGNDGYFGKIDGLEDRMLNGRLGKRDIFKGNNPRYFDGMRMKNLGDSFMNTVKNIGQSNEGLRQGFYDQMNKIRREIIPNYRGNNGDVGMSNGATKEFFGSEKFGPGKQEVYVGGGQGLNVPGNFDTNGKKNIFTNGVDNLDFNGGVGKAPINDAMHNDKTRGADGGFVDVGEPMSPYKGGIDSFPGAPL